MMDRCLLRLFVYANGEHGNFIIIVNNMSAFNHIYTHVSVLSPWSRFLNYDIDKIKNSLWLKGTIHGSVCTIHITLLI